MCVGNEYLLGYLAKFLYVFTFALATGTVPARDQVGH